MRALFISFLILFAGTQVTGQRICDTRTSVTLTEPFNNKGQLASRDTISNEIITIPVVIHILYYRPEHNISEAQVLSQLEALNNDFSMMNADVSSVPAIFRMKAADTRIRFCLAKVDPMGRSTSGIIRKSTNIENFMGDEAMKYTAAGGSDAWDRSRYLNIWVCNMFGRSLGYSSVPGSQPDRDGVVINWDVFGTTGTVRPPFNKGRTATHEVAHWLGLKHIWGDEICGSDDVDDTPPQKSYNFSCPSFPRVSDCSVNVFGDMFMNFMDLTDDACMNFFTYGQKMKMRSVFAANGFRNSILSSSACDAGTATGGPLPEAAITPEPELMDVKIFPNPVVSALTIEPVNNYELRGVMAMLYSAQGKVVKSVVLNTQKELMDMNNLPPGVYMLKIGSGKERRVFKVVKL